MLKATSDSTKTISKYILLTILYALLFGQVFSFLGQPYTKTEKGSLVYEQVASSNKITVIISIIAVVGITILFFTSKATSRRVLFKSSMVLLATMIIWTFLTALEIGIAEVMFVSAAPYVYITALAFCIGFDEELFKVFIKHAKILGLISLAFCLYFTMSFIASHPGNVLADSISLRLYIQSFFLLCICSFCSKKTNRVVVCLEIALLAILSLTFSSRSWLIQSAIWLFVFLYVSQKKKNFFRFIKVLLVVGILVGALYVIALKVFPEMLQMIIDKISPKETRVHQYSDLFKQTDILSYLFGEGFSFKYYSSSQGIYYSYIDNSYLMIVVRYGIFMLIPYVIIFLTPLFKSKLSKESIPIVLWLLALGGLSIFCMIIIDIKSIALAVVAGRVYALAEKRKSGDKNGK